ncbi:MAG: twin-arginine translocation signal domain-containing protein [Deltaproteobacteria bacterium]|nr:twin-arginine translocation signal domain-containing protein [Deltaproteobacteria bacterium]
MNHFTPGRRDFLKLLGMGGGAALLSGIPMPYSFAKDIYPSQRISWIIPVKPGGGMDLVARSIIVYLQGALRETVKEAKGATVVAKNVPEAGGRRAYSSIFNARPDGYTIGDFNSAFVTDSIVDKIDFDYTKYTFLVRTGAAERVIVARKNTFKTWDELFKAGKTKELKMAASNFGRGYHVACILVKEATKLPARLINFPGSAENMNALVRGDVDIAMLTQESAKAMVAAGEFKALLYIAEKSAYPGVPSIADIGHPELAEPLKLQRLVIGPPNLPKPIKDVLIAAFKKVLNNKEFLEHAKKIDFDADPLYGADAENLAKKLFAYYTSQTPLLKKYLL